jgi:hypothetical protein
VAGVVTGCLLAAYLVTIAVGLATGGGTPLTPWPRGTRPSHAAEADPGPRVAPHPSPSTTRPSARTSPDAAPSRVRSSPRTPATTAPATASSRPGKGRGRGLTKSPNPRRP